MSKSLNVTLMMDEGWVPPDDPDLGRSELPPGSAADESAPAPAPLTERHVAIALRELGHRVRILPVGHDVQPVVAALSEQPPDLVFNLIEQFRDERGMVINVVALLEMMGLPFTGTGWVGLMLCRDKGLSKQLLSLHKIQSPRFATFPPGRKLRVPRSLPFPVIVKPQFEEGSDGIARASIVHNADDLAERVRLVHQQWRQLAIAEEYVEGRELYVGLLGNPRLAALPAREIRFGSADSGGPVIATKRVKGDAAYREKWNIDYAFADLDDAMASEVARVARRVYRILQLRDYGRIDLRVTPSGRIRVLEVNANPDLGYGEDFAESAERAGIGYNKLIDRILRLSLRRYRN